MHSNAHSLEALNIWNHIKWDVIQIEVNAITAFGECHTENVNAEKNEKKRKLRRMLRIHCKLLTFLFEFWLIPASLKCQTEHFGIDQTIGNL